MDERPTDAAAALRLNVARLRATAFHNAGNALHGQGRLDDAVAAYRAAIEADPAFAAAHVSLGNVLVDAGRPVEAVEACRAGIGLDPGPASAHYALGNALMRCGRWEEATTAYRAAADRAPGSAESHFSLGYALMVLGRSAEALVAHRAALVLAPLLDVAWEQFGHALARLGRRDEAVAAYRTALLFQPEVPGLQYALGKVLLETGHPAEAAASFGRAVRLTPASAEALGGLGSALRRQGRHAEAVAACVASIGLQPSIAVTHATLADALRGLDRLDAALDGYRRAIALAPDQPQTYAHMGDVLLTLGRIGESAAVCRAGVLLGPTLAATHNNLGNALKALGRVEEAAAAFAAATARAKADPLIHLNHALALLTLARFGEGWEEYEWRWRTGMVRRRDFVQPQWTGDALEGRTILLHAEQGMGDTLHFARYAPLVAARGGRVLLEVQKPLLRLMQGLAGVERVIVQGEPLPSFDVHCPLLGLPRAFATRLDTIPGAVPYLHADPALVEAWRPRVPRDGALTVGLVWAGEARKGVPHANRIDRQRSLTLGQLAPLAGISGVRFLSLQMGAPAEQLRDPPPGLEILDLMDGVGDFADTAALVAHLDLVIGVDTSVIHLAGGLGKPVWVLSRFDGCWRWLTGRDDSPWYPTLRLYRQDRPQDWASAISRLARDLRAYATAHKG